MKLAPIVQFELEARRHSQGRCHHCGTRGPMDGEGGMMPMNARYIIPIEKCGDWTDRFNPMVNSLVLCMWCEGNSGPWSERAQARIDRAKRALEAWKIFDRETDEMLVPGLERARLCRG